MYNYQEIITDCEKLLIKICSLAKCSDRSLIVAEYYRMISAIELYYENEKENKKYEAKYYGGLNK